MLISLPNPSMKYGGQSNPRVVLALETGTQEFDDVSHELGILSIDLSKLIMAELYVVQYVSATEIRIRESALAYQE